MAPGAASQSKTAPVNGSDAFASIGAGIGGEATGAGVVSNAVANGSGGAASSEAASAAATCANGPGATACPVVFTPSMASNPGSLAGGVSADSRDSAT